MQPSPEQIIAYANALQADLLRFSVFDRTELLDSDTGLVRATGGDRFIEISVDLPALRRAIRNRSIASLVRQTAHNAAIDWVRGKE